MIGQCPQFVVPLLLAIGSVWSVSTVCGPSFTSYQQCFVSVHSLWSLFNQLSVVFGQCPQFVVPLLPAIGNDCVQSIWSLCYRLLAVIGQYSQFVVPLLLLAVIDQVSQCLMLLLLLAMFGQCSEYMVPLLPTIGSDCCWQCLIRFHGLCSLCYQLLAMFDQVPRFVLPLLPAVGSYWRQHARLVSYPASNPVMRNALFRSAELEWSPEPSLEKTVMANNFPNDSTPSSGSSQAPGT
ncbi:hypothetical protein RRG08_014747 [Elysia crispata]|uniref:Uncharacterized protein n=1 Tax=Elysia crispata TaxID=231223 RepID=A0AAE1ASL5_9GAST|nr:hypothetical protein RRG08_014747 [Elysia crispata]